MQPRSSLSASAWAPHDRHPGAGEALEHVHEVNEAIEIVLEPQHDLAARRRVVEKLLLLEQLGAHAQQVDVVALRERARAILDPVIAGDDRTHHERLAIGHVLARNAAAPRDGRERTSPL
jgi:hypothetical protein